MSFKNPLLFVPTSTRSNPLFSQKSEGRIIGWKLHHEKITCISAWSTRKLTDEDFGKLRDSIGCSNIGIVGIWRLHTDSVKKKANDQRIFELMLQTNNSILEVHIPHYIDSEEISIIYYNQPNSRALQYLSLEPLNLDPLHTTVIFRPLEEKVQQQQQKKSIIAHATLFENPNVVEDVLEKVLAAMNSSLDVERHLVLLGENQWSEYQSCIEFIYEWGKYMGHLMHRMHLRLAFPSSILIHFIALLLNLGLSLLDTPIMSLMCLKDISVIGQQLHLRFRQAMYWPWQFTIWRGKPRSEKLQPVGQAQYIGFYNSVWLMANDIIIGITIGAFVSMNADSIALMFMKGLKVYGIETIQNMVVWLMSWPGGLKLNNRLATFLGELFLWLVKFWDGSLKSFEGYLPIYIKFAGLCGTLGISFSISFAADLLTLTTLHLYLFYLVAAKLHNWQVTVILSLFNLFRGQRNNPLRQRIDAADYDLDQLLLGTILFTVLIFLFPTVAVYYLLFYMSRVAVIALHGICDIALAIINHFPLFAIMLRLKDPGRLPAGIKFRLSPRLNAPILENVPIGPTTIFYQYWYLLSLLKQRIFSREVIKASLDGSFIRAFPSLQYPSPPRLVRIANFEEFYQFFVKNSSMNIHR